MNTYRRAVMSVTTCAAGLSLAACSAGVTTASPVTSPSPATIRAASSPTPAASRTGAASTPTAAASRTGPASASPAETIIIDAPMGSFPVPHGAQVLFNENCDKEVIIELSSVTPSQASSFYTSQLPRAGYKITGNTLLTGNGNGLPSAAQIEFTGHGYKGTITGLSNLGALASTGPSPVDLPDGVASNFFSITLAPPGANGCPTPAGP